MFDIVKIKDVKQEIGLLVKSIRKQKGISQSELATKLDVSRTTIQNLELGENFTINTVLKICKEFDLLDQLMNQLGKHRAQVENNEDENQSDIVSESKSLY